MTSDRKRNPADDIHPDLRAAHQLVYEPSRMRFTQVVAEVESADYGASGFDLDGRSCKFRVGKVTPRKAGFFVTLWKRLGAGPIQPYDWEDPVDLFVVSVRTPEHFGQFVFPKTILCDKGVISKEGREGKRAIRVYPPWVTTTSGQAKKTQAWQIEYFIEIPPDGVVDAQRVAKLFF